MNLVAPSPSRTMAWARSCATSTSAARRTGRRESRGSVTGRSAACPLAANTKLSLVDVSPSIVTRLNDASPISPTSARSTEPASGASVATKASIVAILGAHIPAPFAMPVTVTFVPSTSTRREAAFGTVSVVMIARAAESHPVGTHAKCARGNAESILSTGSGSMMTPVEKVSTSCAAHPTN